MLVLARLTCSLAVHDPNTAELIHDSESARVAIAGGRARAAAAGFERATESSIPTLYAIANNS